MLAEKNIVVASTNAWYQSTYASENKGIYNPNMLYLTHPAFWWNKSMSCGPIVEQATHLCTSRPLNYSFQATSLATSQET